MATKNTLFNYFKKVSNGNNNEDAKNKPKTEHKKELPVTTKKVAEKKSSDSRNVSLSEGKGKNDMKRPSAKTSSAEKKQPAKKRRRILMVDDDTDEENAKEDAVIRKRNSNGSRAEEESGEDSADDWQPTSKVEESSSSEDEPEVSSESEAASVSEEETPKKKVSSGSRKKTPSANKEVQNKATAVTAVSEERIWVHLTLDFLNAEKLRDGEKRRPDHPDYNPRTLYVPPDFIRSLTPAMKQWWEVKARHFDCVIFLKLGKFYELYHMDAAIGVSELGLIFMKHRDVAHSGFPEAGYSRYAKVLVEKGYKVARVEQTETPEMMQNRCKKMSAPNKFDKVVKREVCQISTKGTRMYLAIEGDATSSDNAYLLAITEKKLEDEKNLCEYGICFVDTSLGTFCVGQFTDDRHKSELRTLLAHHPPAHILVKRGSISDETKSILNSMNSSAIVENLAPVTEFLNATQTLKVFHEKNYFGTKDENNECDWPKVLLEATEHADLRTPLPQFELAISALGGCVWYLTECKLDTQVLSTNANKFSKYSAHDLARPLVSKMPSHMVLDSTTLLNMDVVTNSETGGKEGTLMEKIDNCCTPFGKRLLREWLCSPLCSIDGITLRQDAVAALIKMPDACDKARKLLKDLPDLERLLMRISVYGNAATATNHPDSRAIFYEDFSKKKIQNLLSLLRGFKSSLKIVKIFQDDTEDGQSAELLQRITHTSFPELQPLLDFFDGAFDATEALNTGILNPKAGVDAEYEAFNEKLKEVDEELKQYLRDMKKLFGCEVKYIGLEKKRYQIEIPERFANKVPSNFELTSSRKGFKRYYSPKGKELLAKMMVVEEEKKERLSDLNRRMFARFADSGDKWTCASKCLGTLDVLLSFAKYAMEEATCMPSMLPPTAERESFVDIKNGRLPTTTLSDFIPNDTTVGMDGVHLLLLTGPNMGGKSTLMRQLGLIVIMAQIGCPVPAEECSMIPIDRIFTRLGARDHIIAGESTFFVEMSETSAILKHATQHSLVLIDELGRGTTTFDGAAIASAVLETLISKQCCTVFSTHYHFLVDKYKACAKAALVHMACMEEEEEEEEEGEAKVENVTFLYKLASGACPSSHGFNAARLAGLPIHLVLQAKKQALKLQSYPQKVEIFQKLMSMQALEKTELAALLKQLHKVRKWSGAAS